MAHYLAARGKRQVLLDADWVLGKLRFYMRVSHARKLTNTSQYGYAAVLLTAIGKLLGGWLETVPWERPELWSDSPDRSRLAALFS